MAELIASVRELWQHLAGAGAGFAPAVGVAVSPRSYLCPPGWSGNVVIGDDSLATAPDPETAGLLEQALSGLPAASLTDPGVLSRRLPIAEIRGPAVLAYLDPADFRPPGSWTSVTPASSGSWRQRVPMTSRRAECGRSPRRPSLSSNMTRSLPPPATGTGRAAPRT